jgi:dihydroorotate dehydrogenase
MDYTFSHRILVVPMADLYKLAGPVLRLLDPEAAHGVAICVLKAGLAPVGAKFEDPILSVKLWDLEFANPIGLAAGFDKNAEVPDAMCEQGFGFVEIGSVTPRPQIGNPKPRLFRLTRDRAVINRMGFNNDGMDVVAERLAKGHSGILGVNLGKNKDTENALDDYVLGAEKLASYADYIVVNVSSPNTPGLRLLQGGDQLKSLLAGVREVLNKSDSGKRPPLLVKIAPDLADEDLAEIATVSLEVGIDGLIATNTTIQRPASLTDAHSSEGGGLSGQPLMNLSTSVLSQMYQLTEGKLPLIGVGGVSSGADAYEKIRAGASLVQLYSALVYQGPGLVNRIKRELLACLKKDGFASITDAVGADHR